MLERGGKKGNLFDASTFAKCGSPNSKPVSWSGKGRQISGLAHRTISSWNNSPKHALAINRHIMVSRFGHMASLMWARLILGRFRDAVLADPHSLSSSSGFFDVFSSDPRCGVYRGR